MNTTIRRAIPWRVVLLALIAWVATKPPDGRTGR